MDEKGFAYTLDAVLALIPVMIVLLGISNLAVPPESHSQIQFTQKAQDTMDLMVQYKDGNGRSVLDTISSILKSGNNSQASVRSAGRIASCFLDEQLPGGDYLFTEENQLGGEVLAGELDPENTEKLATASRNCGNYTFRIYVE
ncbi:hypothetical protein [Methanobacterium petrolearium]|uniref:hypothetical protein n=1 Tax=Methanobacterium petrolearium TaxID=710190 RepID=UPI001AE2EE47|nr:hypothetical protein [Methanobacterium petrolearium]MBP1944903.1 hypothetical protein [Methanobacterium petrolearium]